jgi:quinoprotein glucose dehydrogenase
MSVDEALGLVCVPLGNQPPDQWGGTRSASVERISSSVVALELANGRVRWVFQTVHHDLWDYDVPSQPSLVDLTIDGRRVPALVQPTKQGEIYVLDRRNGTPVLPVREVPPRRAPPRATTRRRRSRSRRSPSGRRRSPAATCGARRCSTSSPAASSSIACATRAATRRHRRRGRWCIPAISASSTGAASPSIRSVKSPSRRPPTSPSSRLVPRADDTTLYVQGEERPRYSLPALNENFGAPYAVKLAPFISPLGIPCQAPPWGYVAAADLTTGRVIWMHRNGTVRDLSPIPLPFQMGVPDLGGPIMTAGGVAFLSGTLDNFVRAYDVATGRQLWESRLPAGGQATPMTYTGADGRQFLLVVAGGHGSLGTKAGDSVIAYALPRG